MPKTIQIRGIDDEIYDGLRRRAAEEGVTVPELLRAAASRLAAQPSIGTWLRSTRRRSSALDAEYVRDALDEIRGGKPRR